MEFELCNPPELYTAPPPPCGAVPCSVLPTMTRSLSPSAAQYTAPPLPEPALLPVTTESTNTTVWLASAVSELADELGSTARKPPLPPACDCDPMQWDNDSDVTPAASTTPPSSTALFPTKLHDVMSTESESCAHTTPPADAEFPANVDVVDVKDEPPVSCTTPPQPVVWLYTNAEASILTVDESAARTPPADAALPAPQQTTEHSP